MKISFMIGNGFDIEQGAKTSYKDFYKQYCIPDKKDNDVIKNLKVI